MKKKLTKKMIKRFSVWIIILGIALPTAGVMVKKTFDYYAHHTLRFFTPKKITCTVSNVFCQKTHDNIMEFIAAKIQPSHKATAGQATHESLVNFDRVTFYNQLKQKFPIVKSLDWRFSVSQTLHLNVIGTTPYCIINDHYVLGDQKRLFSKDLFQDTNLTLLPRITINQPFVHQKISPTVYNFLHKIPPAMWQEFNISYHSPSNIELIPHQSICKCRIIADEKTFFHKRKFNALSAIFGDLCTQGFITKQVLRSQTIPLAFDFRIKDQIIIKFYDSRGRGKGL